MAELWAIWDGLELVVSLGFTHAIVELDAQVVVSLNGLVNAHDYLMPHYGRFQVTLVENS